MAESFPPPAQRASIRIAVSYRKVIFAHLGQWCPTLRFIVAAFPISTVPYPIHLLLRRFHRMRCRVEVSFTALSAVDSPLSLGWKDEQVPRPRHLQTSPPSIRAHHSIVDPGHCITMVLTLISPQQTATSLTLHKFHRNERWSFVSLSETDPIGCFACPKLLSEPCLYDSCQAAGFYM